MPSLEIFYTVYELANLNRPVLFSEIPEVLREDFQSFIGGKTIVKRNNEWAAYPHDALAWCHKLNSRGVDYPLNLNGTATKITKSK